MADTPDTTVVELLRAGPRRMVVRAIRGAAWRMLDVDERGPPLQLGEELAIGDTVALAPAARVELGEHELEGGPRGRAFALVAPDAFRVYPGIDDVPRLLRELEQLEAQGGEDPLARSVGARSAFEDAVARDFAFANLTPEVAAILEPARGRALGAVALFFNGDAVCVALAELSVGKIRRLMALLGRPISAHLVDDRTLSDLLDLAYGRGGPTGLAGGGAPR